MQNTEYNQKSLEMNRNIYNPDKAKRFLLLVYRVVIILFSILLIFYFSTGEAEELLLKLLGFACFYFILFGLNGYFVVKETNVILTETEISGIPMRTFFFWKPENVVIQFEDVIDITHKVEWGYKDTNKFSLGFVIISSKKGRYKFLCSNPEFVRKYIINRKNG